MGRKLFDKLPEDNTDARITVHSSQYAAEIFEKPGFVRAGELKDTYRWYLSGK